MTTTLNMTCMGCEKKPSRHGSHYCTDECGEQFAKKMQGPVTCIGRCGYHCGAEAETVKDATAAGWVDVSIEPEGSSWNYSGYCPECARERDE